MEEEPAVENTVRVAPDGPLYIEGRVQLHFPDGEVIDDTRVALCRCGDSQNKPFCDNTHLAKGFADPGLAVEHRLGPRTDGTDDVLRVRLAPNGPILVEGPLQLIAAGDTATGRKGALCRCGSSRSKPYCDGTHATVGFAAE